MAERASDSLPSQLQCMPPPLRAKRRKIPSQKNRSAKLTPWEECYREIRSISTEELLFFRGQNSAQLGLTPSLARLDVPDTNRMEQILYYDFTTRAGDLVDLSVSKWEALFAMQHAGVPTRLLDWTQTLGVALYFALKGAVADSALWILDPFILNDVMGYGMSLPRPDELDGSYEDYFVNRTKTFTSKVMAIWPVRYSPRVSRQRASFTLHSELKEPLDQVCPQALHKVAIPAEARHEALAFLQFAGISEFTLFPDLDGLARELRKEHLGE